MPESKFLYMMDRKTNYTGQQRAFCVKQYYLNNYSCNIVRRLFRTEYQLHKSQCPSSNLIREWVEKFEETGTTLNTKQTGGPRISRSKALIQLVAASVLRDPTLSIRKRSVELGIPRSSLRRILLSDLKIQETTVE